MLNENNQRAVLPKQIAPLIPWDKLEGCIIICKGNEAQSNYLVMSSLTFQEITLLHAQLGAHINGLLMGSLVESIPFEDVPNVTR